MKYFTYNIKSDNEIIINKWIDDYIEKTIINVIGEKKNSFMPTQAFFEILDVYKVNAHRAISNKGEILIFFDLFIMEGLTTINVDRYVHRLNIVYERRKLKIRNLGFD
jgi:hypothetical protein